MLKFRTNSTISTVYDPSLNINIKQLINMSSMMIHGKPYAFLDEKDEPIPDINDQLHATYEDGNGTVFVPIDKLIINGQAQRFRTNCLTDSHVMEIIKKFDVKKFNHLEACVFNGEIFCTDGQGRLIGLIAGHPAVKAVPVSIKKVDTWEEVVVAYINNHNPRLMTAISPYDDFNTSIANGDTFCTELKKIFLEGFTEVGNRAKKNARMIFTNSEGRDLVMSFKTDKKPEKAREIARTTNLFKRLYYDGRETKDFPQQLFRLQTEIENFCKEKHIEEKLRISGLINPNMTPVSEETRISGQGKYEQIFRPSMKKNEKPPMLLRCNQFMKMVESVVALNPNAIDSSWLEKYPNRRKTYFEVFRDWLKDKSRNCYKDISYEDQVKNSRYSQLLD